MEAEAVEPAFGVAQGGVHLAPVEAFDLRGVAVGGEAGVDEAALGVGEEVGMAGVVGDEVVGGGGDDDSEETFLKAETAQQMFEGMSGVLAYEDKDPSPAVVPAYAFHEGYPL